MKNKVILLLLSLIVIMISVSSRVVNDNALFSVPSNFPKPTYHFESNPLTPEGVLLGKTLFYDAIISSDNTVSCGSCHQQSAGFTQHGHAFSHGVNDFLTKRNSMPLHNLAWSKSFGWDGGVHDLDLFAISPITNPVEMNESVANVLEKLRKSKSYPTLFKSAFGSEEINTERFLKALAQFMLTMVSANSKYDKFKRREGVELTTSELAGLELYKQKCAACHAGELFTDFSFRNNGLSAKNEDNGRFDVNQTEADKYKFKVPSLRNLAYTSPYMHDGRFETLEQVLDHYDNKAQLSNNTDPLLKNGIKLTDVERANLIAFLNSLNDNDFVHNQRFSELSYGEANNTNIYIADWTKVDFGIVPVSAKDTINSSLKYYFEMKNALVQDKFEDFIVTSGQLLKMLKQVNKEQMSDLQKSFFLQTYNDLQFDLKDVSTNKTATPEHQRQHFTDVSKSMYKLLKAFKANKRTIFYLNSSKINDNRSIYWLSENNKSLSPYFKKDSNLYTKATYEILWGNEVK